MGELFIGYMLLTGVVFGTVGAFLGSTVDKRAAGFLLGVFLGPIGWIIVFLLPRDKQNAKGGAETAALFVGIGMLVLSIFIIISNTSEPETRQEATRESSLPSFRGFNSSLSISELMLLVANPAVEILRETVSTPTDAQGIEMNYPTTESGWEFLLKQSALIIETGNVMAFRNFDPSRDNWIQNSRAVSDAGVRLLNAVTARDKEEYEIAINELNSSCDGCHEYY